MFKPTLAAILALAAGVMLGASPMPPAGAPAATA